MLAALWEDAPMALRIFLVDDHEVVRRGVRDMLEAEDDFEVVGEAGTVEEALHRIPATAPDVAVLDVRLPDGNGVELCRELRSRQPQLACLMLTSFDDDEALFEAIVAGAAGYVLKQVKGNDIVEAIRHVGVRSLVARPGDDNSSARAAAERPIGGPETGSIEWPGASNPRTPR